MTTTSLVLGLGTLVVAFVLAGYAARLLHITTGVSLMPSPPEAILGYGITALACLLSLIVFGHAAAGAGSIAAVSLIGAFMTVRARRPRRHALRFSAGLAIKLALVGTMALVYGPSLLGASAVYRLPDVFDLPKNISATIAAAHASTWPAPNPYFPELPFAYNLLFYAPLGLACRAMQSPASFIPVFAAAALWTAWQTLGCLELVMRELGVAERCRAAGLLLGTFVAGFTPLIVQSDVPIGFAMAQAHLARTWVDDPLVSFVYVPQHIFSVACMLAAWTFVRRSSVQPPALAAAGVATVCGALASFILAPIVVGAFGLVSALAWYGGTADPAADRTARTGRWTLLAYLIVAGLAGPFLVQASRWGGAAARPLPALPSNDGWVYLALAFGWVLPLGAAGAFVLGRRRAGAERTYAAVLIPALLVLLLVKDADFDMKATMYLRLTLVPLAAVGLAAIWTSISARSASLARAVVGAPLLFGSLSGIVILGYLISSAYVSRPPAEAATLNSLRSLPFGSTFLVVAPSQEDVAVAGHLAFMDESMYRNDAYLPVRERPAAGRRLQRFIRELCPPSSVAVIWDPTTQAILRIDSRVPDVQRDPLGDSPRRWTPWPSSTAMEVSGEPEVVELASPTAADVALTTPVNIEAGLYRISVVVQGHVRGHAHVSLHGFKKLIDIPEGDYPEGKRLAATFLVDPAGFHGELSFGLGGWASGAGRLRLTALELGPLKGCGDSERP